METAAATNNWPREASLLCLANRGSCMSAYLSLSVSLCLSVCEKVHVCGTSVCVSLLV